jgi:hypothetical protein
LNIAVLDQTLRAAFFPLQARQALLPRVQLGSQRLQLRFFAIDLAPEQGVIGQAALNHGRQNNEHGHEQREHRPAATLLTQTAATALTLRVGKIAESVPLRSRVVHASTTRRAARVGNFLVVSVWTPLHRCHEYSKEY